MTTNSKPNQSGDVTDTPGEIDGLAREVLRLEAPLVVGKWVKGPAPDSDDVEGYSLSSDMDCTVLDGRGELVAVFLIDKEAAFTIACRTAAPTLARALQAERAEVQRLRAVLDAAPHTQGCDHYGYIRPALHNLPPCTCWKASALSKGGTTP